MSVYSNGPVRGAGVAGSSGGAPCRRRTGIWTVADNLTGCTLAAFCMLCKSSKSGTV